MTVRIWLGELRVHRRGFGGRALMHPAARKPSLVRLDIVDRCHRKDGPVCRRHRERGHRLRARLLRNRGHRSILWGSGEAKSGNDLQSLPCASPRPATLAPLRTIWLERRTRLGTCFRR